MTGMLRRTPKTCGRVPSLSDTGQKGSRRDGVLRTLAGVGAEVRDLVLVAYRRAGGSHGWRASDVTAMASAMTRVEDALEMRRQSDELHDARRELRALRRRLECEVWP